jgi:hypothetical protein
MLWRCRRVWARKKQLKWKMGGSEAGGICSRVWARKKQQKWKMGGSEAGGSPKIWKKGGSVTEDSNLSLPLVALNLPFFNDRQILHRRHFLSHRHNYRQSLTRRHKISCLWLCLWVRVPAVKLSQNLCFLPPCVALVLLVSSCVFLSCLALSCRMSRHV